jgi:alpha-L-fucosidase
MLRPECIINSRIQGCRFPEKIPPPHCDYITSGDNEILEKNIGFEWENPGSRNTSCGYNPNDHKWVSTAEIVFNLVEIVNKGGNSLLNVGPTPEGLIPQPCIDRLAKVGEWMEVNGELKVEQTDSGVSVSLPTEAPDEIASIICLEIVDQVAKVTTPIIK